MNNVEHYIQVINKFEKCRDKIPKQVVRVSLRAYRLERNLKKLYQWARKDGIIVKETIWIK